MSLFSVKLLTKWQLLWNFKEILWNFFKCSRNRIPSNWILHRPDFTFQLEFDSNVWIIASIFQYNDKFFSAFETRKLKKKIKLLNLFKTSFFLLRKLKSFFKVSSSTFSDYQLKAIFRLWVTTSNDFDYYTETEVIWYFIRSRLFFLLFDIFWLS